MACMSNCDPWIFANFCGEYTFSTNSRGTLKEHYKVFGHEYNINYQLQVKNTRRGHGGSALVLGRCFEPRQIAMHIQSRYEPLLNRCHEYWKGNDLVDLLICDYRSHFIADRRRVKA